MDNDIKDFQNSDNFPFSVTLQQTTQTPQDTTILPEANHRAGKTRKTFILAFSALVVVIVVFGVFLLMANKKFDLTTKSDNSNTPNNKAEDQNLISVNVGGIVLNFDKSWSVKTKEWTESHAFFKVSKDDVNQVEIEFFSLKDYPTVNNLLNPLLRASNKKTEVINGQDVLMENGTETFAQSKRNFARGVWSLSEGYIVLTVLGKGDVEKDFSSISDRLIFYGNTKTDSNKLLKMVKNVNAQEPTITQTPTSEPTPIGTLPDLEYKEIKIMADPYEAEITKDDFPYRDGYAKGFKFFAFKSQRLIAVAFEDKDSNPNSFIESQLFSEKGEELSKIMGTRIEFTAPYTGEYYMIVNSFNQQEGRINVGVDDREQTDVTTIIKYPNGDEILKDPTISKSIWVGNSEVGLIIEIPNPVEVINTDTFKYQSIPVLGSPRSNPEEVISRVIAYISNKPGSIPSVYGGNFQLAEHEVLASPIQLMQIGLNRVLVTPTDGLFPSGSQISVMEASEGIIRFFTEDLPIAPSGN